MTQTLQVERTETSVPLSLTLESGETGLSPTVAIRDPENGNYLDFADDTFKASGWTTRQLTLTEISATNSPGRYEARRDISAWSGLSAGANRVFAEFEAATAVGTRQASDTYELLDDLYSVVDAVWDEAQTDHVTSGSIGESSLLARYAGAHGPGVYLSEALGVAGTTLGLHGTPANPSDSWASARTLAAALGVSTYYIGDGFFQLDQNISHALICATQIVQHSVEFGVPGPGFGFGGYTAVDCTILGLPVLGITGAGPGTVVRQVTFRECLLWIIGGEIHESEFFDCGIFEDLDVALSKFDGCTFDASDVAALEIANTGTGLFGGTGNVLYGCRGAVTLAVGTLDVATRWNVDQWIGKLRVTGSRVTGPADAIRLTGHGELDDQMTLSAIDAAGFLQSLTIAASVWDKPEASHVAAGSFGLAMAEMLGLGGRHKVVEVLTKNAGGFPLTQRVRIYDSSANAALNDGATGLIRAYAITDALAGNSLDKHESLG